MPAETIAIAADHATETGIGTNCPGLQGRPGRKTRFFQIERFEMFELNGGRILARLPTHVFPAASEESRRFVKPGSLASLATTGN